MKKPLPDPDKLFNDVLYDYEIYTKSKLEDYRNTIIALSVKNVSKKKIVEYLNDKGIDVCYSTLWRYLEKKPITYDERTFIKKMIIKGSKNE